MFCSSRDSNLGYMAGSHLLGFEQRLNHYATEVKSKSPKPRWFIGSSAYLIGLTLPKFINTN